MTESNTVYPIINLIQNQQFCIPVITSDQIRMARAALRMGIRELAALAKVAPMTISRLESGRSGGHADTIRKIQRALEKAGVEFIDGDEPGVRLKKRRS